MPSPLEILYSELIKRSEYFKGKDAEQRYSDLEIDLREQELTIVIIRVQQLIITEAKSGCFSKN